MEPKKKKQSSKKDPSRNEGASFSSFASNQPFVRPPTTGTSSSSSSDDRSTSTKSSDDQVTLEDKIEVVPTQNKRPETDREYPFETLNTSKEDLDLKFDRCPSAYFSRGKNDVPAVDPISSPQEGYRVPSPSSVSSLTLRPLEWDSGADVGYLAHDVETGLSTIERIALAQGSAVLLPRSDPEGTTETAQKPTKKAVCPAIEKILGAPNAESTLIKDKLFSSPLSSSRNYLPEGISPIVPFNKLTRSMIPVHDRKESPLTIEPSKNLNTEGSPSKENQKFLCVETTQDLKLNDDGDNAEKSSKAQNLTEKNTVNVDLNNKTNHKSTEDLSKVENDNLPSAFLRQCSLKKSASCSNLQMNSNPMMTFLKPLRKQAHHSASSSSVSTVIDKSKKKPRQKLFVPSTSVSEKAESSKNTLRNTEHASSSKDTFSSYRNKTGHQSHFKIRQSQNPPVSNENKEESKRSEKISQIAFHSSIQQSILDELQQCVNEISSNFNKNVKNSSNSDRLGSVNDGEPGTSRNTSQNNAEAVRENCSTLESVTSVQTNDSWLVDSNLKESLTTAEKAKSFEYLPGDAYERNSSERFQVQKNPESSSSNSEKIDFSKEFSESSKDESWNVSSITLFEREMERGINLLKNFIDNATNLDVRKKQLLVKKIAKKLINLEYENIRNSSREQPTFSAKSRSNPQPSEGYFRDSGFNKRKETSSELSSSQISPSYVETSSGSSCLNLVMKPDQKSSDEISSKHSERAPSGIQYIQENYQSNNCSFNSDGENDPNLIASDPKPSTSQPYVRPQLSGKTGNGGCLNMYPISQTCAMESSSTDWSKSANTFDDQTDKRTSYCAYKNQRTSTAAFSKHPSYSPSRQRFSKFKDTYRKESEQFSRPQGAAVKNPDDFIDGRPIIGDLPNRQYKPFSIADRGGSSFKPDFYDCKYFPWQDWRKPTSYSESVYEEKRKESKLLYNFLDAERRNHLLWIQSEINHLSNLKNLIEKQEKLKEGFQMLKNKKIDSEGDFLDKRKASRPAEKAVYSGDDRSSKVSEEISSDFAKPLHQRSSSRKEEKNTSDKENKDESNKNSTKGNTGQPRLRLFENFMYRNYPVRRDLKGLGSSNESQYVSAASDGSGKTWDENNYFEIANRRTARKSYSSNVLKQKKKSSAPISIKSPVSYTIVFNSPKAPPVYKQPPTPSIIPNKKTVDSSSCPKSAEPYQVSLQECLVKNHPEVVRRAEFRRNCIAELANLRQLQNEKKKQLVLAFNSKKRPSESLPNISLSLPPLKEKRIFSQKKLRQQTEKKYKQTFEVTEKLKEMKVKENYRTNRLMAETFAKKLQRRTLKGQVDLSNSVMIIQS